MKKSVQGLKRRHTPIKKRSQSCYSRKVAKITRWLNRLLNWRKNEIINPNTKQPTKRKELKKLSEYIDLLKPVSS
jgi:hypothetical protein